MWFFKGKNLDPTPPEEKESIARLVEQNEVRLTLALKRRKDIVRHNHLGANIKKAMSG